MCLNICLKLTSSILFNEEECHTIPFFDLYFSAVMTVNCFSTLILMIKALTGASPRVSNKSMYVKYIYVLEMTGSKSPELIILLFQCFYYIHQDAHTSQQTLK